MQAEPQNPLGSGAMFDSIAKRYDRMNRILSLGIDQGWRRQTAEALELPAPPCSILDLATGTADLAIQVAHRYPQARVLGIDPSPKMLEIGQTKITDGGLANRITLQVGDAQDLPIDQDSVDAATMAFGIRNVPDRLRALREMVRVVREGGRVAILELSEPEGGALSALARIHVRKVVPWLGGLLSGAREYRYLQESIARFPPAAEFAALMEAAGLVDVHLKPLTFGVCHLYVGRVGPKRVGHDG